MHTLSICFGPAVWQLMFKTEEAAKKAYDQTCIANGPGDVIGILDDFGQTLTVKAASIHGVMLEDMEQTKLAHIERALHQQRTQLQAQKTASSDPAIRAATMMQGPAVIDPTGHRFNGPRMS